jgi:hypothetical protein
VIGKLRATLEAQGLAVLGGFHPDADDLVPGNVGTLVMVGNVGSAFSRHFQASPEAAERDPLDCWTRRVVGDLAADLGADVLFPFDGPPFHPFQRWARRADPRFTPSPLGLLIHAEFGLWTALRAALLLQERLDLPAWTAAGSPCDTCEKRPCLSACPVGAFTRERYDVVACRAHLGTLSGQDCMMGGCLARRACPVGRSHTHARPHAAFHMRAFRSAR